MLKDFNIDDRDDGTLLVGLDMNNRPFTNLPLPVTREQLRDMIREAAQALETAPRVSVGLVHATQRADGVRVEFNQSWFDLPWRVICKRLFQ